MEVRWIIKAVKILESSKAMYCGCWTSLEKLQSENTLNRFSIFPIPMWNLFLEHFKLQLSSDISIHIHYAADKHLHFNSECFEDVKRFNSPCNANRISIESNFFSAKLKLMQFLLSLSYWIQKATAALWDRYGSIWTAKKPRVLQIDSN